MKARNNIHNCRGLSLIELMIAMVIGLLLLGATATMFTSNKRIYKEQDEMGRLQENARFALQLLIKDIRMAGYAGCANDMENTKNHLNDGDDEDQIFSFHQAIEGLGDKRPGDPWELGGSIPIDVVTGTDAFAIRYLAPTGITLSAPMPSASSDLEVEALGDLADLISAGDIIALADCASADIMQVTQVPATGSSGSLQYKTGVGAAPGNAKSELQKQYNTGDEAHNTGDILRLVARRYYIGTNANGNPALYRFHRAQDKDDFDGDNDSTEILEHYQELIEGVENMQILYGIDSAGNDAVADSYQDANCISEPDCVTVAGLDANCAAEPDCIIKANWSNVVSMRLALLFRTVEENTGNDIDTKGYDLLGTWVGPANDRRRRRVVNATVQIRNRSNSAL